MTLPMNAWTAEVHDYMLVHQIEMTALEITTMFGRPEGATPVGQRLYIATKQGAFSVERLPGHINRYKALDKFKHKPAKVYPMANSIFQYASAL